MELDFFGHAKIAADKIKTWGELIGLAQKVEVRPAEETIMYGQGIRGRIVYAWFTNHPYEIAIKFVVREYSERFPMNPKTSVRLVKPEEHLKYLEWWERYERALNHDIKRGHVRE